MSIQLCDRCQDYIDTDADVGCYIPMDGVNWKCLCEGCREDTGESESNRLDDPRRGQASEINRRC